MPINYTIRHSLLLFAVRIKKFNCVAYLLLLLRRMRDPLVERKVVKSKNISWTDSIFQIRLLCWKRYVESTKSKWELLKLFVPAVSCFVLLILLYNVSLSIDPDGAEPFLVPLAFWIFMQRIVVQIMFEKYHRLQESMRMMGMSEFAYWMSYILSEGVVVGFVLSFLLAIVSTGGLFNDANFGVILGFLFVFCLSAVPFCFFICSFFNTPQTAGQATLAILLGKLIYFFFNSP